MSTVREIEALVAERKIRDLLIPERHRQAHPVVKGGVRDLVAREASARVGHGNVADLASPALDQRNGEAPRSEGPHRSRAATLLGHGVKPLPDEIEGALDLEPADESPRADVASGGRGDGDV